MRRRELRGNSMRTKGRWGRRRAMLWILIGCAGIGAWIVMSTHKHKAHIGANAIIGERMEWKFEYDDLHRVVKSFDPAGRFTRYEYGSAPDGSLNRIALIPPTGTLVSWNLNGNRVVEMHDAEGSVRYTYDEYGNVASVERANSTTIRYAYDAAHRVTEMQVGAFYRMAWTYDYLGQVSTIATPAGLVQYDHQTGLGEVRRSLPNGITTFWKIAPNGRLASITHGIIANPKNNSYAVVASYDYNHGPDGRISAERESSRQGEITKQYAYDKLGRLAHVTGSDRQVYTYEYDDLGNRTRVMLPGGRARRCEYDWAGSLVSVDGTPVSHDACGNVTGLTLNGVARTYKYHPNGRLAEVSTDGDTIKYTYDGYGRLVARESKIGKTNYIVDPFSLAWHPLEITEPDGSRIQIVWEGDRPLALIRGGNVQWLLGDHLDSVRIVADNKGAVTGELTYDPFGVPEVSPKSTTPEFGFTGLLYDLQAGGLLTLARVYVPELGCFLQPDPTKRMPSPSPEDIAPYSYCGFDAVNFVDRSGAERTPSDVQSSFFGQWATNPWLNPRQAFANWSEKNLATLSTNPGNWYWVGMENTGFDILGSLPWRGEPQTPGQKVGSIGVQIGMIFSPYAPAEVANVIGGIGFGFNSLSALSNSATGHTSEAAWDILGMGIYGRGQQIEQTMRNLTSTTALQLSRGKAFDSPEVTSLASRYFAESQNLQINHLTDAVHSGTDLGLSLSDLITSAGQQESHQHIQATHPSPVGGVKLSGASKVLDGLGQVKGVRVDANGNIVLLCEDEKDLKLPPLRMDEIVTVFRSVYLNGEGPTVTIDPNPVDPERAPMLIKHSEATDATYCGWILYVCDRLMKTYSISRDNNTNKPIETHVPGFDHMQEKMFFGAEPGLFGTSKPRWERFWIVPAEVQRFDGSRRELTLFDIQLKVNTQKMKWQGGQLVDDHSGSTSVGAAEFTEWFRKHYDEIGAEQYLIPPTDSGITQPVPVFTELRRIALLTAIAEKLRDDSVPMPSWMKDYLVKRVTFEKTTPVIRVEKKNGTHVAIMVGGVNISADPKVVKTFTGASLPASSEFQQQTRIADQLEHTVVELPVATSPFSIQNVNSGEHAYKMFVMPGAQTQALNPGLLEEADLVVPVPGGTDIRLTRSFNSFFASNGPWGAGWALDLPRLDSVRILKSRNGDKMVYTTGYDLSTPLNGFRTRFKDIKPVAEYGGSMLQVPEESCPFLGIADGHPSFLSGTKTPLVLLKSGEKWHFTPYGELVAVQDGPQTTVYERDTRGQLTRIVALIGGSPVTQIALEYEHGRLSKAISRYLDNSSRKSNELVYRYNQNNQLVAVSSAAGEVGYDYYNSLVSTVSFKGHSRNAKPTILRTFAYDENGSVTKETYGDEAVSYSVVSSSNGCESVSVTAAGKSIMRYDRQFRLVEAVAAEGSHMRRIYNSDGSTVTELSSPGRRTITVTESVDARTRTLAVAGAPTIRANYDGSGHLTQLFENQRLALAQRWNPNGQVAAIETPTNLTQFEYDKDGVLSATIVTPPNPGKVFNVWTRTQRDRRGNLVEIADYRGLKMVFAYDPSGALISAIRKTPEGNFGANFTRDDDGKTLKQTSSWGETSYSYDHDKIKSIADRK